MAENASSPAAWEAHERDQRRAWLRLTPRERLDWLWQAKLFVERVKVARAAKHERTAESGGHPGDP